MRTLPLIAKIALWLCAHACLLGALLTLTGCGTFRGASGIVAQQTPGQSTGAGATFTGPANSAAASTQTAQRRVAYYPPTAPAPAAPAPVAAPVTVRTSEPAPATETPPTAAPVAQLPAPLAPPAPAWIDEKIETSFGQHQDAAGLVKAATAIGSWGRARWLGILCILFAAFALAWAHNNPDGYPLVAWKIGAVGLFLALFDPSPWWLLLLIIPAAFYAVQKLKITLPT